MHNNRKQHYSPKQMETVYLIVSFVLTILAFNLLCPYAAYAAYATDVADAPDALQSENKNPSLTPTTLQLRWFHQFQFAGYYAAKAKGYYEEAGLDVTIQARNADQDPIAEVLEGRAQFGVTNSEVLIHALNGKPLSVLASIFQHSPLAMLVRGDSRLATPHDLIGKQVRMSLQTRDVELQAMFLNEGVELEQLELSNGEAGKKDYLDPSLDALAAYVTNQPYYLDQLGVPYRLIQPRRYGIDFYGDCLFTSREMIEADHKTVHAFTEASLRGWEYAMAFPGEIIELIIEDYGVKKPRSHLQFEARQLEKLILPNLISMGHMNPGRWQHIAETFARLGLASPEKVTPAFLDDFIHSPVDETNLRSLEKWIWTLAAALLILIAFATFQSITTRRLRKEIWRREKAEEALRLREAYHRILFEHTGTSTVVIQPNGLISLANKESEHLFKMPRKELEGKAAWINYVALEERQRLINFDNNWLATEEEHSEIEFRFQNSRGEIRNVQASIGRLPGAKGTVCSITDLTPRIKAEQEREEVIGELEIKNEELERFAYTVSHDLKSPLITINGFLGILEEALEERDHGLIQESIRRITGASDTMLSLLDELLELSRVGRIGNDPSPASLTDLARDATEQAQGVLDEAGATVSVANDLPEALCDRIRILEVFRNLYENAARYGAPEGPTRIEVTNRVDTTEKGLQTVFMVKDNGMGIDSRYTERIFNLFEQLNPRGDGTGIGLALVRRIIEHHGGKIWAESKGLGHGSTFCFTLGTPKPNR